MVINIRTLLFLDEKNNRYPEWETKKLGEVAEVVGGGTPSTAVTEYWNGNIQWFSPTDIGEAKYVSSSGRKITEAGLKASSAKVMPVGTVLLTTRASLGRMAILDVPASTNQGFQSLIPGSQTISDYLYYLQPQISAYCDQKASGSTFKEISGKEIRNMTIPLPSLSEQQRIAEFFSALDERIALVSAKVKLLKEQKRGYQQRIFSGELVFTDDNGNYFPKWEQKKLGGVLTKYTDTTIYVEDNESYNQLTVSTSNGILNRGSVFGSKIGRKRQFVVNLLKYPVTLTFTRQTVMNGGIGFIDETLDGSIVTENMPLLSLDTSQCNKDYLNQYLKTEHYQVNVLFPIKPTGSAQQAVHEREWLQQPFPFPSLPEQEKIAKFLDTLDENIALNERKLNLLKETKKGYLQGIFG